MPSGLVGLLALGISLAGGSGEGGSGSTAAILLWLGATAGAATPASRPRPDAVRRRGGQRPGRRSVLLDRGDLDEGRDAGRIRVAFLVLLILGYPLGTALLQVGYQGGGALTVAGLATLLTNAVPIAAGTIVLDEPVPSGAFGGLRVLAFAAVTIGAVLLARPERRSEDRAELRERGAPSAVRR